MRNPIEAFTKKGEPDKSQDSFSRASNDFAQTLRGTYERGAIRRAWGVLESITIREFTGRVDPGNLMVRYSLLSIQASTAAFTCRTIGDIELADEFSQIETELREALLGFARPLGSMRIRAEESSGDQK